MIPSASGWPALCHLDWPRDSGESPTPFPILTFCLWDQRDDDQEEEEQMKEHEEEEDGDERRDSSSESETEGADLSHVSTGSESELEPSPLFLKCKPSIKRKVEKESEDEGTEEKKKEQDQQTELTLESLGKLVLEAEVIQIRCKKSCFLWHHTIPSGAQSRG